MQYSILVKGTVLVGENSRLCHTMHHTDRYYASYRRDTMHHPDVILCITQTLNYPSHKHDTMHNIGMILYYASYIHDIPRKH